MINYNKERYEQQKAERKQRSKQRGSETKEIKLSFSIEEHDFQTKVRLAQKFFKKGHNVKVFMRLIGRENLYAEQAQQKAKKFATDCGAIIEKLEKQNNTITAFLKKDKDKEI